MKKYYKVVLICDDRFMSFNTGHFGKTDWYCREYFLFKWTKPTAKALMMGYGLTCFDSMENLNDFIGDYGHLELAVFECEIGRSIWLPTFASVYKRMRLNDIKDVISYGDWPAGTVMTDKIKLVRRIK
jgi:hypothetical protein